jgi:hypothetical protein
MRVSVGTGVLELSPKDVILSGQCVAMKPLFSNYLGNLRLPPWRLVPSLTQYVLSTQTEIAIANPWFWFFYY